MVCLWVQVAPETTSVYITRLYSSTITHFMSTVCFPSACVASRPGQSGRCDGYILEGRELEFYIRKMKTKKGK